MNAPRRRPSPRICESRSAGFVSKTLRLFDFLWKGRNLDGRESRYRSGFLILALALSGGAFAQQPQSYYVPTARAGLTINISSGTWYCGGAAVSYASGSLPMSASTTNYVFMSAAPGCAPSSNTTGFPVGVLPIAVVTTNATTITNPTSLDTRSWLPGLTVFDVTSFPGTDAAQKINACIVALPTTGGTCDARGLTGAQTLNSDVFSGVASAGKPGTLLLGAATFTVATTQNPPPSWRISGAVGGAPPAGLSAATWGTKFVAGTGVSPVFKFNDVFTSKFEGIQIDCNSHSGSVGIWYTADNQAPAYASSQNEFTNFGIYNCQYAFQIGLPVTQTGNAYQMDQLTVRRFQIVSAVSGAEGITFNASNAAQIAIFEEGSIQKVNLGFDVKYYGGLAQWKRIAFGGLANQSTPVSISAASNTSPIVITTTSAHAYVTGQRVQIASVGGNTAANGNWYITDGVPILGASNASPIAITTSAPHGYSNGDQVQISGVGGNTAANGTWIITAMDSTHFSLNSSTGNGSYTSGGTSTRPSNELNFSLNGTTGSGPYTSGGTSTRLATAYSLTSPSDFWIEEGQSESGAVESAKNISNVTASGTQIKVTITGHGYQSGDVIKITGVVGTGGLDTATNAQWQITRVDADNFTLNESTFVGAYTSNGTATRVDVNFISVNGIPYTGGAITLLHNKFDEPVVVNRAAQITSIDNYGGAPAVCLAGSNCRVVSINDRFTNPGPLSAWDTSASGQMLRLGGGDRGTDYVTITSPASITGSGLYSTTRIVAGVNNTNTSGGSVTIDASTGNTETVTMSGTSTNVTINGLSNCQQGEWLTVDVIAGVANRTISFASPPFHGGGSVSSTGLNNHYRQLFYCDTGTDAYAVSPLQTAQ